MTPKERDDFIARWLDVLNSPDAGGRKHRRIIIDALAKVQSIPAFDN